MTFEQKMQNYVGLANQALEKYLPETQEIYHEVHDAMRYSVGAGGKRVRPVLTLAVCDMLGGDVQNALPFAAAIECIHSSSLIHDDLPCMDDDDLRRGKPSCHVAFGEATALLAGDGLILRAFSIILHAKLDAKMVARGAGILAELSGVDGMIGGQVIDLMHENKPITAEALLQMYRLKTGALIQAACQMGGVAASALDRDMDLLEKYAMTLGLAFQVCDDILDVVGDQRLLGKPIGSDEKSQKNNYITLYGLDNAKVKAEQLTNDALSILQEFPESEFLEQMTTSLLQRER